MYRDPANDRALQIVKAENIFKEIPFALEKIFPPVSEDSEDAVEHAEQMKNAGKCFWLWCNI